MRFKKSLKRQISNWVFGMNKSNPNLKPEFRILLYHSISDKSIEADSGEETTPKALFDEQMRYLRDNGSNVISIEEALGYFKSRKNIPAKSVCISFDDGFKDNYYNALPILKKYGLRATFFITYNLLRDISNDHRFLSFHEIGDIKKLDFIDIGCHGLTHRALSEVLPSELTDEIVAAKKKLEDISGKRICVYAYPFGHNRSYNKKVLLEVKRAGFIGGVSAAFGANNSKTDPFLLKRNRISWLDDMTEFQKHLSGAYDWYAIYQYVAPKRLNF